MAPPGAAEGDRVSRACAFDWQTTGKIRKKTKPDALSTLIPKLWDFIVSLDRSNENKYEVAHLKSETIPFLYIV